MTLQTINLGFVRPISYAAIPCLNTSCSILQHAAEKTKEQLVAIRGYSEVSHLREKKGKERGPSFYLSAPLSFTDSRTYSLFKRSHATTALPSFPLSSYKGLSIGSRAEIRPLRGGFSTNASIGKNPEKILPLGLSSFEEIIKEKYLYVDKTDLALQLIQKGKYYFLARPRGFGKSLLVSTLKSILSGNRELFKKCSIYNSPYAWEPHPVVHLDFSSFPHTTPQVWEAGLKNLLRNIATSYGVPIRGSSPHMNLVSLVRELSKRKKVAVLIEEYDRPLIDNLHNFPLAQENHTYVKSFLGAVKSLDADSKFVFVTGATKFSLITVSSGLNNLYDITMDKRYAHILGYTEQELKSYFSKQIQGVARRRSSEQEKVSEDQILEEMKLWYNGYRFSPEKEAVYNPYSTLCYLKQAVAANYSYSTHPLSF